MSRPLNSSEIAAELAKRARELDRLVADIDAAERTAVHRREDYTLAYAQAFLCAEGAMDVRRYQATQNTHEARLAAELAEQQVRGMRRQIESVRARIDVGRSLGAAVRAEVSLGGAS